MTAAVRTDDEAVEIIRDHARRRVGAAVLTGAADASALLRTPTCGDRVEVAVTRSVGGVLLEWDGRGCEISQASASMLAEASRGRDERQLGTAIDAFLRAMGLRTAPAEPVGDAEVLLAVAGNAVRSACATLAWRAARAALDALETPADSSGAGAVR